MTVFRHMYWGYELTIPDFWVQRQESDVDVFAATADALDPYYHEAGAGQIHARGEWNWARQNVEPLWSQHIGSLAGMLSAKNVGSAPWRIGDAVGLEAEIVLPKKTRRRLWTGILMRDFCVLHFMVTHPLEVRQTFEPEATKIIASLRFPESLLQAETTAEGLPLPPDSAAVDVRSVIDDIGDPAEWCAFSVDAGPGALQAFYLRELSNHEWDILEYVPFPSESGLGFARYQLQKAGQRLTLGIMPSAAEGNTTAMKRANVVCKILK